MRHASPPERRLGSGDAERPLNGGFFRIADMIIKSRPAAAANGSYREFDGGAQPCGRRSEMGRQSPWKKRSSSG